MRDYYTSSFIIKEKNLSTSDDMLPYQSSIDKLITNIKNIKNTDVLIISLNPVTNINNKVCLSLLLSLLIKNNIIDIFSNPSENFNYKKEFNHIENKKVYFNDENFNMIKLFFKYDYKNDFFCDTFTLHVVDLKSSIQKLQMKIDEEGNQLAYFNLDTTLLFFSYVYKLKQSLNL